MIADGIYAVPTGGNEKKIKVLGISHLKTFGDTTIEKVVSKVCANVRN